MANPEHLGILSRGVEIWNRWRVENPHETTDLSGANLSGLNLENIYLCGADLHSSNLSNTRLGEADLGPWEYELEPAAFVATNLASSDLEGADLKGANLSHAYMAYANLRETNLEGADLSSANLHDANLSRAVLIRADLSLTDLEDTIFEEAEIGWGTIFAHTDLSKARGLESIIHHYYSTIDINTIYYSRGNIPEVFLQGCGLPEDFIIYARSLITKAIDFYSCFISYSSKDEDFATCLHADLQSKGVRVWFAPHDMRVGAKLRPTIDESIKVYDKLLLVLSGNSVGSQWVEQEVETALAKEREQEREVLFPVRLDDVVLGIQTGWPALIKNSRHVGDFTHWKRHDSYKEAFERLLRDLKAEA